MTNTKFKHRVFVLYILVKLDTFSMNLTFSTGIIMQSLNIGYIHWKH